MNETLNVTTTFEPTDEVLDPIRSRLRAYNESKVGRYGAKPCALTATVDGRFVGGMFGWLQWGWLYVDWAYVEESERRTGVGSALLVAFEKIAREAGVSRARLNTASFQGARPFYERHGYVVFAELPILAPDGSEHVDFFLKKTLSTDAGAP